jgi:hypothetical protein
LHWATKPELEPAAGESPGLECFWVWGWRTEGGEGGAGGQSYTSRQPAALALASLSAERTSVVSEGRLATIAEDQRALP